MDSTQGSQLISKEKKSSGIQAHDPQLHGWHSNHWDTKRVGWETIKVQMYMYMYIMYMYMYV